ncbi:TPA: O-antigen ligase family protein [Vibrio vulnificus]
MIDYANVNRTFWFTLFLFVVLFKPTPTGILGVEIGLKIPDFIFIGFTSFFLVYHKGYVIVDKVSIILFTFIVLGLISQVNGVLLGNDIIINDLVDLMIPMEVVLAYLSGVAFYRAGYRCFFNRKITIIFSIFVIFSYLVFFDLFSFKFLISNFYEVGKSRGYSEENIKNIWRLASTFTNPNYFGIFCSVVTSLMFYLVIREINTRNTTLFLSFFVFVVISGSRTALISLVLSLSLILVLDLFSKGIKTKQRAVFYCFLFLIIIFALPKLLLSASEVLWRFTNVDNMEESFGARLDAWSDAFRSIEQSTLIGVGSNKSEIQSLDSNYILILYKNGIIGLLMELGMLIYILFVSFKLYLIKNKSKHPDTSVGILGCCSVIILSVSMITSIPLRMSHIVVPFYLCFGYINANYKSS